MFLTRNPIFFNGFPLSSTAFQFSSMAFQFSSMAFCFPQRLSAFFNGLPIFLHGFPLSKKSKKIYLRRQVYKRSLFELCISCHLLPELSNSCYNVYTSPTHSCGAPVFPTVRQI
jgi:hypothetical protein